MLFQFLGSIEGKVKGLKGFLVMNHTTDENEIISVYQLISVYGRQNTTWKYFIIHPIKHLVSLSIEHRHYLKANPKELTMQYHFLEYDVSKADP